MGPQEMSMVPTESLVVSGGDDGTCGTGDGLIILGEMNWREVAVNAAAAAAENSDDDDDRGGGGGGGVAADVLSFSHSSGSLCCSAVNVRFPKPNCRSVNATISSTNSTPSLVAQSTILGPLHRRRGLNRFHSLNATKAISTFFRREALDFG